MMNLTVINYMLPSHPDDLIIKAIKSYGEEFWKNVDTNLIFKKNISQELKDVLKTYNINFKDGVQDFWISQMYYILSNVKTEYVFVWEEDIEMLDIDYFMKAFELQKESGLTFLPSLGMGHWNKIADAFASESQVEDNGDFRAMGWGTEYSTYCEQSRIKKKITDGSSTPYPISIDGIFETQFFMWTLEHVMCSKYWEEASQPGYIPNDWAKNPNLPHSYEVFWSHNKRTEECEYTILIPKKQFSTSIDPKDYEAGRSQIFQT